jgi:hypothetical protein
MMVKRECVRCGLCCLCSPCFFIGFGEERMEEVSKESSWRVHICDHLSFDGDVATCALVRTKEHRPNGLCSNGDRDGRLHMLEKLRQSFKEKALLNRTTQRKR